MSHKENLIYIYNVYPQVYRKFAYNTIEPIWDWKERVPSSFNPEMYFLEACPD